MDPKGRLNKLRGAIKYGMLHHQEGRLFYLVNRGTRDIGFLHVFRPQVESSRRWGDALNPQQISIYGLPYTWYSLTERYYQNVFGVLSPFVQDGHLQSGWYLGRDITMVQNRTPES